MTNDVTGAAGAGASGGGDPHGGAEVGSSSGGSEFKLEGASSGRGGRGKDMERWAKVYSKGARTIWRWIAAGEKSGEACPLDRPAEMPGWWARHMTWSVPREIEEAAVLAIKARASETVSVVESVVPPAPGPGGEPGGWGEERWGGAGAVAEL
jgi:hypothetical protein